jgi:hypothetical protein
LTIGRDCKGVNNIHTISVPMNSASGRKNGAKPVPNVATSLW